MTSQPGPRADTRPRLRVGVIGAGRVGSVLGHALARAGHEIVAASAVSEQSRVRAQRLLPAAAIMAPDEVVAAADLVLLAVPDDQLVALIEGLGATGAWRAGQLVAHTSGAHGLLSLAAATQADAVSMALHPAMTFTGRPEDVDRLPGAVFGITAAVEYRPVAETLVLEMGGEPVWVPETARPLYHAALSHAANHLVVLIADAVDTLAAAGVEAPARVVRPLAEAALDNALRLGDAALTGPVSRGDADTVARHLDALRANPVETTYRAMAVRATERAYAAGRIAPAERAALIEVLDD